MDIIFRLQRQFKVKIPRGKIVEEARGSLSEAEFEKAGIVSGAANYPNPFNPVTTISFNLLEPTEVTVTVYDVLGRHVATLLNDEPLEAGLHTVRFDTRDVRGKDLSSGVYLYRLRVGEMSASKKLVLMK